MRLTGSARLSLSPLWLTQVLFKYASYFYVSVEEGLEREVESVLRRKFAEEIADVVQKDMWDLDMPNHLAGHKRTEIQLKFRNCQVASILVFPPLALWWSCRPRFKKNGMRTMPHRGHSRDCGVSAHAHKSEGSPASLRKLTKRVAGSGQGAKRALRHRGAQC